MSGAIPWSVKGIDPRARDAAREAARRQGLTIGEWLNQAIMANEAALEDARSREPEERHVPGAYERRDALAAALRQLAERLEADDRRNALAVSSIDHSLSSVAARIERAESEGGRVADLLDELRDAQGVLHEHMRRIQEHDLPALRAQSAESERLNGLEDDLQALSARALAAEDATRQAIARLDVDLSALDSRLADAVGADRIEPLESRLDAVAHDVAMQIAEARADMADQIAAALGGLQPEDINEALADVSRRLTAAERRHTQTIEAVSIEIKRLSESIERRLRAVEARNDDNVGAALREEITAMSRAVEQRLAETETREAEAFSRIGDEVSRVAERLDVRAANAEQRSAAAIEQIGEQISLMAERWGARQDKMAAELTERIVQSEERQGGRLSQALASISSRLGAIETHTNEALSPVSQAMDTFAARLRAIEGRAGAPVALPEVEPDLEPVYLEAPVLEPAPAPHIYGLQHEADLHARQAPVEHRTPDQLPAESATEEVYLEDIESEFQDEARLSFAPQPDDAARNGAPKNIDDPFADIEASPPEEDEEDIWSTGRPSDDVEHAFPSEPRPEPYRLPRALDETDGDDAGGDEPFAFADHMDRGSDDILLPESSEDLPLVDDELEHAMFGDGDDPVAPKEDYLAAARRAALAHAAAAKTRPSSAPGASPAAGLRGVSRVALWGAAGALAAALAGGVYGAMTQSRPPSVASPRKTAALRAPADGAVQAEAPSSIGLAAMSPARAGPLSALDMDSPASTPATIESAAAHGDAVAQYELALTRLAAGATANGVGLLQRAAEQGLAMAQYRLAKLYERGEGVPANLTQARLLTERAAIGGNRKAMHDLGVYYARGEGAPFDEKAAFKWFREAAEYGVPDSQYNLGVLYSQGRGVGTDLGQALYWFTIAGQTGDADAQARASAITSQIGAPAAAQAKARAKAFRVKPAITRANGAFGPQPWTSPTLQAAAADTAPHT